MKPAKKIYIALCLFVLIAAACGPVTPLAIPTVTNSPASTLLLSATSTPSLKSSLPSDGPEKDISSYQLQTWREDDYTRILAILDDLVGENEGQISSWVLPDYHIAFQLEHLLKFPNSSVRNDIFWDILFNKPGTTAIPGIQPIDDLMSSLISEMLKQNVRPTDLRSELENHGIRVDNTVTVHNVMGNGEDGLVLLIGMHGFETLTGVFIVFRDGEEFQVQNIRDWEVSEWVGLGRYFEVYDVGDVNNNGLPEIIIQVQTGGSGTPQIWKESIDQIEWSPENGIFRSQSFPVFWQACDQGPCEGDWEFSTLDSQSILTTRSYWSTRKDCPDLSIQRTFVWNGTEYSFRNAEVVPPGDGLPPECRLAWAETAIWMPAFSWDNGITEPGWKNDLAISIVERSLNDWPAQADTVWGTASRDYFKLRLGIWYELRNQGEKARKLLQQIANRPVHAEYDFMSRLASIYLENRASSDRVRACLELENAFFEEFRTVIPEPSPFTNDEEMLKAWGIVDGKGSICDVYDMLPADVEDTRLVSPESLMEWIAKTELTIYQYTLIDLNNDKLEDYVFLLDTLDEGTSDAWAFLATPKGFQARYISQLWSEDEQSKLHIEPVTVGDSTLAHLINSDGDLIVFQVAPDLSIDTSIEEYGVQSFEMEGRPIRISVQIDNNYDGQRTVVYQWDSRIQSFVVQADEFAIAQAELEKMLYVAENYQATVDYIDSFLQTASSEPKQAYMCGVDIPDNCKYLPDWYMPYFRYLRGLAYEQLGQVEQAKQAYYELWQDFPKNVFGMAAGLKLEPINP